MMASECPTYHRPNTFLGSIAARPEPAYRSVWCWNGVRPVVGSGTNHPVAAASEYVFAEPSTRTTIMGPESYGDPPLLSSMRLNGLQVMIVFDGAYLLHSMGKSRQVLTSYVSQAAPPTAGGHMPP